MRKPKARTLALACIFLFILIVMHFSSYKKNSNDIIKEEIRLVILILSAPNNVEQRNAIRKTWLSQKNHEVKHYFVVGLDDLSANQKFSLHTEDSLYEDLLLMPNIRDTYRGITKKVLYAMRHIHEVHEFSYLLKCDDDSFVLVDELLADLKLLENQQTNQELYWGFFDGRAKVKKSGSWMEKEWFLCDYYLPYALGGGYVLSYNLVEFISNNYKILKMYNSEDISVGLWLAPLANINRRHDVRFNTEYRSRGCSNHYLVSHKQQPEDMIELYQNYLMTKNICTKEEIKYSSYEYNWDVAPSQCCKRQPGII